MAERQAVEDAVGRAYSEGPAAVCSQVIRFNKLACPPPSPPTTRGPTSHPLAQETVAKSPILITAVMDVGDINVELLTTVPEAAPLRESRQMEMAGPLCH